MKCWSVLIDLAVWYAERYWARWICHCHRWKKISLILQTIELQKSCKANMFDCTCWVVKFICCDNNLSAWLIQCIEQGKFSLVVFSSAMEYDVWMRYSLPSFCARKSISRPYLLNTKTSYRMKNNSLWTMFSKLWVKSYLPFFWRMELKYWKV